MNHAHAQEERNNLINEANKVFWKQNPGQMSPPWYFVTNDTLREIVKHGNLGGINWQTGALDPTFCMQHGCYFVECGNLGHGDGYDPKETL